MSELRKIAKKSTFFALEPSFFEIFQMNKTGVIYMSVAFYSHIECENRSKNEQAMQKR